MRRADRLFQIIQALRRSRLTTAAELARELEVSDRTIYRDIVDLTASGVPIEGEAGVGYTLLPGFDLPPLLFNTDAKGQCTVREVQPLGLFFWGKVWTLTAWCRLRDGFRHFRLDRVQSISETAESFEIEAGKSLQDCLRIMQGEV